MYYYDLVERNAIDRIYDNNGDADSAATSGTTANAFGSPTVPTFMGLRVIVSDDVPTTGSGASTEYSVHMRLQPVPLHRANRQG